MKLWSAICLMGVGSVAMATGGMGIRINEKVIEVPIDVALAPAQGYDDNDNVQVVIHGNLPNYCYTLGNYKVEKADASGRMRIRQFAVKKDDELCLEEDRLPEHMKMLVPFTAEISLGQLPPGQYDFIYGSRGGSETMSMDVEPAGATTVDSKPYAIISNAMASDVLARGKKLEVTLSGVLNSSCTELDEQVELKKIKNVYVVLPTIRRLEGVMCAQMLRPFERKVDLGVIDEKGHFLVHVRSMNGKSVNRVVEIE